MSITSTGKAAGIDPATLSTLANIAASRDLASRDVGKAAENLYRIASGLKEFESLNIRNLSKNIAQLSSLPELSRSIGTFFTEIKRITGFRDIGKDFGKPLEDISSGLSKFAELSIPNVKKNLKEISEIPDIINKFGIVFKKQTDESFKSLGENFGKPLEDISSGLSKFAELSIPNVKKNLVGIADNFEDIVEEFGIYFSGRTLPEFESLAENFGKPLEGISSGLIKFSEISISKVKRVLEELKTIPDIIGDLSYIFSGRVSDDFADLGKNVGKPLGELSEGLIKFSEISVGKLVKNLLGIKLFGFMLGSLNSIRKVNLKGLEESYKPLLDISAGLVAFSEISFVKLIKNLLYLKVFGRTLGFLGSLSRNTSNLRAVATNFGKPLKEIADALTAFAEIKWGKLLLSTLLFKTFNRLIFPSKGRAVIETSRGTTGSGREDTETETFTLQKLLLGEVFMIRKIMEGYFTYLYDGDMDKRAHEEAVLDALRGLKPGKAGRTSGGGITPPEKKDEKGFFGKLFDTLKDKFKSLLVNAIPALLAPLAFIPAVIGSFFSTLGSQLRKVFTKLTPNLVKKFDQVIDFLGGIFKPVKKIFTSSEGMFKPVMDFFGKVGKFGSTFASLGKVVGRILGKIALPITILMGVFDGITGFIDGFKEEGILGGIKGAIVGVVNGLVGFLVDIPVKGLGYVAGWLGFENVAEVLKNFSFKENFQIVVDTVFDTVEGIIDWVSDGISTFIGNILDGDIATIIGTLFPLAGLYNLFVPESIKENISEFFKEAVRGMLPNPKDGFIAGMLSKVIPDAVYKWAGVNPKTGELLPVDKLKAFTDAQVDPKKTGKEVMQMRKDLKTAGYTDEMIDDASKEAHENRNKELEAKAKEEEKKKQLEIKAADEKRNKPQEEVKTRVIGGSTLRKQQFQDKDGKWNTKTSLILNDGTEITDPEEIKKAQEKEQEEVANFLAEERKKVTKAVQRMGFKNIQEFETAQYKAEQEAYERDPNTIRSKAADDVFQNEQREVQKRAEKERITIAEAWKKHNQEVKEDIRRQAKEKGITPDEVYTSIQEAEIQKATEKRLADLRAKDSDLLKPPVQPVGQAMNTITADTEKAKMGGGSVIAPVSAPNNNVTNNNNTSMTTVVNSNIPDRTVARYGYGSSMHAWA